MVPPHLHFDGRGLLHSGQQRRHDHMDGVLLPRKNCLLDTVKALQSRGLPAWARWIHNSMDEESLLLRWLQIMKQLVVVLPPHVEMGEALSKANNSCLM